MTRTEIINGLISSRLYESYLEIGVRDPSQNYDLVHCKNKWGVDPDPSVTASNLHRETSDEFFRKNSQRFDLIFIDGDHTEAQAFRDVANALSALNPEGAVVIHDVLPPSEFYTRVERKHANRSWTGDVWKAVLHYMYTGEYACYVVDSDWGVAVIDGRSPRTQILFGLPERLDYEQHFNLLRPFCVTPEVFLERCLPDYLQRFNKAALTVRPWPSVGVVVGSYRAPAYVHLQLECWKRFYPTVPLLVHDDASEEGEKIAALCFQYGAAFYSTQQRQGHQEGDLSACIRGLEFGHERGVDIMVKFSRTWLPLSNFLPELQHLAYSSQYATYSNVCTSCRYGFRSECVAWHVPTYVKGGFVAEMKEALERRAGAWGMVEHYLHEVARKVSERTSCKANTDFAANEVGRLPQERNYGVWEWMERDCRKRNGKWLWHRGDDALEYYRLSKVFGLPYHRNEFEDAPY